MEKQLWEFKRECHQLMQEIWGYDKKGTSLAYVWFKQEFGKEIHFSEINDLQILQEIHLKMTTYKIIRENRQAIQEVNDAQADFDYINRRNPAKKHKKPKGLS